MATKYYEIRQINGNSTTIVLVQNPYFEGNGIHATKVGEWEGKYYYDEQGITKYLYTHVQPADFMISGNATCTERTDAYIFSYNPANDGMQLENEPSFNITEEDSDIILSVEDDGSHDEDFCKEDSNIILTVEDDDGLEF